MTNDGPVVTEYPHDRLSRLADAMTGALDRVPGTGDVRAIVMLDDGGSGHPVDPEAFEKLKDPAEVAALVKIMKGRGPGDEQRFRKYGAVLPVAITSRKPGG